MTPADTHKEGSASDLTLAVGILAATKQIETSILDKYLIMGELSLDGGIHPIKGALPIAIKAREEGILPIKNAKEAAIVDNMDVLGAENILEVIDFLEKGSSLKTNNCRYTSGIQKESRPFRIRFFGCKRVEIY